MHNYPASFPSAASKADAKDQKSAPAAKADAPIEAKLEQTLQGHSGYVTSLTVLPDGHLASGSGDNTIKLWDVKTGACVQTLQGHGGYVTSLTVLPDGRLASGSNDTINLWDVKTGVCVQTLRERSHFVSALTVLPDGRLASGSEDTTIKLWEPTSGACVATLQGHSGIVYSLTMLPDGRLASGSEDTTIKLWDVKTGLCVQTLQGHSKYVTALTMLPDGRLASGFLDTTIKLWDVKTGLCVQTLQGHVGAVYALTLLLDGRLASGSWDTTIKLWDFTTGTCVQTLQEYSGAVHALTMLPDGRLASGSDNRSIKVWTVSPVALVLRAKKNIVVEEATESALEARLKASAALKAERETKEADEKAARERALLAKMSVTASAVSPAAAPLSTELTSWLHELKASGIDPMSLQVFSQQLQSWGEVGISPSVLKQVVEEIQNRLGQFNKQLAVVHEQLELDPAAQAEQTYINQRPKLANYQRKLQQELSKFIIAYFLASTGLFKLEDNKKGMVLNAIGSAPLVGSFLKAFTAGLQFANNKYRAYQMNRLVELFTTVDRIEHALLRFSRQLTLAKEKDIQAQITFTSCGVADKLRGFYDMVREIVYLERHDQKVSSTTGLTLQAEEKLAMLDGAFLVEQVLSGDAKLDARATKDLNVVPHFLRVVLKNPYHQHQTPAHVQSVMVVAVAAATTSAAPVAASPSSAAAASTTAPPSLSPSSSNGSLSPEVVSTKAELASLAKKHEQEKADLEAKLAAREKEREQEKAAREKQEEKLAKIQKVLEKLADDKGLAVGGEQQQVYANPHQSPRQQALGEDMHWRLQAVEQQQQQLGAAVAQHDDALREQNDAQADQQTRLRNLERDQPPKGCCVIS